MVVEFTINAEKPMTPEEESFFCESTSTNLKKSRGRVLKLELLYIALFW